MRTRVFRGRGTPAPEWLGWYAVCDDCVVSWERHSWGAAYACALRHMVLAHPVEVSPHG